MARKKKDGPLTYLKLYFRHVKYYASYAPLGFIGQVGFGVLAYAFYPVQIMVQAWFVDSVIEYYKNPTFFSFFGFTLAKPLMFLAIWLLLVASKEVVEGLKVIFSSKIQNKVYFGLAHKDLIPKIHAFNLREIERNDIFNKLETFNLYWWNYAVALVYQTISFFGAIISLILTFITIQNVSLWAIGVAMIIPLILIVAQYMEDKRYRLFVEKKAKQLRERSYYQTALMGVRTFMERKVNLLYKYLDKLLIKVDDKLMDSYMDIQVKKEGRLTFWRFYDKFLLAILQFYIAAKSISQQLLVGNIWANVTYITNFYNKSLLFFSKIIDIINSLRYLKDLYDIYDMKGFAEHGHGTTKIKTLDKPPTIEFKNLTFRFSDKSGYVFKNLNLKINPSEKVLVLGKDGSGKTALVKVLTTLFPVPHNTYFIDDVPVEKYARGEIKNLFSLVPEDFGRYYLSLRKNISLGDVTRPFDQKKYDLALDITGLRKWVKESGINEHTLPLGTYFYPGIELSSGHWQRIAIARAVYRDRPIFVLDQPFTYIDNASKNSLFERLISYVNKNKKTLIYIGEDVDFIDHFDRVFEKLSDGKLIELTKKQAIKEWGTIANG